MERNCELSLNVIDPHINDLPDTSNLPLLERHGKKAIRTIGQFAATEIPGLFASILARLHPSPKLKIVVNGIQLVPNKPEADPSIFQIETLDIHYQREETDGFVWDFNWLYEIASLFHQSRLLYHFTHRTEANGHGMLAIGATTLCSNRVCKHKGKPIDKGDMEKNAYFKEKVNMDFGGNVEECERFHAHPRGREKESITYANLVRCEEMGDTYSGMLAPGRGFELVIDPARFPKLPNNLGFRPPIVTGPEMEFVGRYYWPRVFNKSESLQGQLIYADAVPHSVSEAKKGSRSLVAIDSRNEETGFAPLSKTLTFVEGPSNPRWNGLDEPPQE